jgi:hypothetical protein
VGPIPPGPRAAAGVRELCVRTRPVAPMTIATAKSSS